jgi:multidrug efflux pump subunit AcrB
MKIFCRRCDKQVQSALETVDGVGAVVLPVGRLRQIRIFADAEKLNAHGITISQFEQAIQDENAEAFASASLPLREHARMSPRTYFVYLDNILALR